MAEGRNVRVAIVDYGLGNLFSVKHACDHVGMSPRVTSSREEIFSADAVILPGVGAFGDAMAGLRRLDLIEPLKDVAGSEKMLVGICLGMQLLMTESHEFGDHEGLGIIEGDVVPLENVREPDGKALKVPQMGWNRVFRRPSSRGARAEDVEFGEWDESPLSEITDGRYVYFVHSLYVRPKDDAVCLSWSRYGNIEFCSSLRLGNVYGFQFHPERSGSAGLQIYRNIATMISAGMKSSEGATR